MPRLHLSLVITAALLAWGLAPARFAPGWSGRARDAMRADHRNAGDLERMERGYYEVLNREGSRLDRVVTSTKSEPPNDFGPLTVPVADLREYVLKPGLATHHRGATWTTNARGMRDREYPIDKPSGTYRIALIGDSIGAGWGVNDGQGFEPTWERSLNASASGETMVSGGTMITPHPNPPPQGGREPEKAAEKSAKPLASFSLPPCGGGPGWGVKTWHDQKVWSHPSASVEVENQAVPGLAPGQRWEHFTREGWASNPDLVIFQGTPADFGWDDRKLRSLLPRGIGWDSAAYREGLAVAHVRPGGDEESYRKALRPHREAILAGVYRTVVHDCRSKGVASVWLLLPRVGKPTPRADRDRLVTLAREAGFTHRVDLSGAFDGLDPATLAIGPDDFHPNAKGHQILARRLDEAMHSLLNPGGDRQ